MISLRGIPAGRRRAVAWLALGLAVGIVGLVTYRAWIAGRRHVAEALLAIEPGLGHGSEFAFSPDGRTLAMGGSRVVWARYALDPHPHPTGPNNFGGIVQFRDVATGQPGASYPLEARPDPQPELVRPILFSPDGSTLVAGNWGEWDGTPVSGEIPEPRLLLKAWDVASGRELATLALPPGYGRDAAFSPDGRTLTASIAYGPDREKVLRWDTSDWRPIEGVTLATKKVNSTAISPDAGLIALACFELATITLHEIPSGRVRATFSQPQLRGTLKSFDEILFSPDGRTLAALCGDNVVQLWDVASGTLRASVFPPQDELHRLQMAFSPDSQRLALGGAFLINDGPIDRLHRLIGPVLGVKPKDEETVGRVMFAEVATGRHRGSFEIPQGHLANLSYSPGGRTLATYGIEVSFAATGRMFTPWLTLWRLPGDR